MSDKRNPALHQSRILAALESGNMTADDLCPLLELSVSMTHYYLGILRRAPRRVRVAGWLTLSPVGRKRPLYGLGSAPDESEPRMSAEQRQQSRSERENAYMRGYMTPAESIALATSQKREWYSSLGL